MEFKLLGSLEITQDGRQAPALARAKEQCLLAVLADERRQNTVGRRTHLLRVGRR